MTLDDWRAAGAKYDHRGHPVFYCDVGSAEPVVLCIHGFPTASWDWHALWDRLVARFGRVVAPDLIGYGFSAKPRGYAYSLLDQADLMEGLLGKLGIAEVHVLSHDYGDSVAQELLARHEAGGRVRIRSVCYLNGGLFPEAHRPTFVQKAVAGPLGPWVARLVSERGFGRSLSRVFGRKPSEAEIHDFWRLMSEGDGPGITHDLLAYIAERRVHRDRWVRAMQTTKVPQRLINGPNDPVSGAHLVDRYRELIPNPDAVMLAADVGHYPQVEDPDAVWAAFEAFQNR